MAGGIVLQSAEVVLVDAPNQPLVYANLCGVTVTSEEAILQFAQRNPNNPTEGVGVVRVTTSLQHIKRLAAVLNQSISQHEAVFGAIETDVLQRMTPEARERLESHESTGNSTNE